MSLGYDIKEGDQASIVSETVRAERYICNFCNIRKVPKELYAVAVDMAAGHFLKEKSASGDNVNSNIDFESGNIKSITEGDVSITYNSDSDNSATAKYNELLDNLCNRDSELLAFRKLRW